MRRIHASGSCSSATVGSCSGPSKTLCSAAGPAAAATASQKRLPSSYWRSFASRPMSRSSSARSGGRSWRRRSSAARSAASDGQRLRADDVHDVLGVAFDDAHDALDALEQLAPVRPADRRDEPALAHGGDRSRGRRRRPAAAAARSGRPSARATPSSSSTRPARCGRSHGTAVNWTACVTSWNAIQVSSSSASASRRTAADAMFGATNSSRAGRERIDDDELELAQDALGEIAGEGARLGRQQRGRRGARRAAQERREPAALARRRAGARRADRAARPSS